MVYLYTGILLSNEKKSYQLAPTRTWVNLQITTLKGKEPRPETLRFNLHRTCEKTKQIYSNSTLEVAWELGVQGEAGGKKKGTKETFDDDE